jgi:hypothetical protein
VAIDNGQNGSTQFGLREYKFIPERPTVMDEISSKAQERSSHSKGSFGLDSSRTGFMLQGGLMHGQETHTSPFGFDGNLLSASSGGNLMMPKDMHTICAFAQPLVSHHQDAYGSFSFEGKFAGYNSLYHGTTAGTSSAYGIEKHRTYKEEELIHGSKKRKVGFLIFCSALSSASCRVLLQ